ncbi:MAG TPA: hypothetical protein PKM61_05835 [bacterium]|nr:hypothetical protein [bacterium]
MAVVAELHLESCPRGSLFDENRLDWSKEKKHLPGWRNALSAGPWWKLRPSLFLDTDREGPYLEHIIGHEVRLVAGQRLMSDYTVRGRFRMLTENYRPIHTDDLWAIKGRVGPVVRMMDHRRYYLLCLEGLERIVLYRREDEETYQLAALRKKLSPLEYYELELTARGTRLTARLNGRKLFEVEDEHYPYGWPGVRFHAVSRAQGLQVLAGEADQRVNERRLRAWRDREGELRAETPQPKLWKEINIKKYAGMGAVVTRVAGEPRLLFIGKEELILADLKLKERWHRKLAVNNPCLGPLDGPETARLAALSGDSILVLDLADGRELRRAPLPPADPYIQSIGEPEHIHPGFGGVTFARLHRNRPTLDLVLRHESGGGSRRFFGYDNSLKPLWDTFIPRPPGSHIIQTVDIYGRGEDEVCTGMHILDSRGRLVWSAPDAETYPPHGGDHMDQVRMARLQPDRPERIFIALATGHEGLLVYDREKGRRLFRKQFGHVQSVIEGRFVPGRKDLQLWASTRWDSYGIHCVITPAGQVLSRIQPNFSSESIAPVDWSGNGIKLAMVGGRTALPETLGLIDWEGYRVAPIDPAAVGMDAFHGHGSTMLADLTGDLRPELIVRSQDRLWVYTQAPAAR